MSTPNVTQLRSPAKPVNAGKFKPSTQPVSSEALTCRVPQACQILNVGATKLNELLRQGRLESFRCGRTRLITMRSIVAFAHDQAA